MLQLERTETLGFLTKGQIIPIDDIVRKIHEAYKPFWGYREVSNHSFGSAISLVPDVLKG